MANCTGITIGAIFDCDAPLSAGVQERLVLINKSDWDDAVTAGDITEANGIITAIDLGAKFAYAFQGVRSSVKPQVTLENSEQAVSYVHQIDFSVFEVDSDQKENFRRMAWKDLVAIVENNNNDANGDAIFEVYGSDGGLTLTASALRIAGDSTTGGAYTLSLKTTE